MDPFPVSGRGVSSKMDPQLKLMTRLYSVNSTLLWSSIFSTYILIYVQEIASTKLKLTAT